MGCHADREELLSSLLLDFSGPDYSEVISSPQLSHQVAIVFKILDDCRLAWLIVANDEVICLIAVAPRPKIVFIVNGPHVATLALDLSEVSISRDIHLLETW